MPKLEWNRPKDHVMEAGLDRGVIYVEDGPAVPWNGLVSVDDDGDSTIKEFFIDGVAFLVIVSARKYKGKITAFTYPDEFASLIGYEEVGDGFYADSQLPQRFSLSYRTMVGAPDVDKKQHYKIHLIYMAVASLSGFSHETITSQGIDPTTFQFDLAAVPQRVPNVLSSAHFIVDTRKVSEENLLILEDLLYGSDTQEAEMPPIETLVDLMSFDNTVVVVYNGDGTWTATGSNENIVMTDEDHFKITNVMAEYLTPEVYQFLGLEGSPAKLLVMVDTDGVPYYKLGEGSSNLAIDTDGVPYFEEGKFGVNLREDTDDTPYFDYN